jgi:lysophospholipid hydrolase
MATMAAPGTATSKSLVDASKAAVYNTAEALSSSVLGMKSAEPTPSTTFGLLGRVILSILSVLPTILYWVTYTLPTWLFTLFSMSLTFTMNFTTL